MRSCAKCGGNLPNRVTIDGKTHNIRSRKFCLTCSPFKQHNTRDITVPAKTDVNGKFCPQCQEIKPLSDFHSRSRGGRKEPHSYCKSCLYAYQHHRWIERKRSVVNLLGGCCRVCGYNRCLSALELHHREPSEKDASWERVQKWSWPRVIREVEKCDLLCCRCHRELHHPEELVPSEGFEPSTPSVGETCS